MHKEQDKPAQAAAALKFFDWAYANGDKMAAELDYVPLPDAGEGAGAQAVGRDQGRQPARPSLQVSRARHRRGRTTGGRVA